MYATGRGVEKNFELAAKYYTEAAEENNHRAAYWLAMLYINDMKCNGDEAIKWLKQAADNNYEDAKDKLKEKLEELAERFYYGRDGAELNYDKAVKFAKMGAEAGSARAQFRYSIFQTFDIHNW